MSGGSGAGKSVENMQAFENGERGGGEKSEVEKLQHLRGMDAACVCARGGGGLFSPTSPRAHWTGPE